MTSIAASIDTELSMSCVSPAASPGSAPGRNEHPVSPLAMTATAKANELVADGCWKGPIPVDNWLIAPVKGNGLRFRAKLIARPEGGQLEAAADSLRIRGADAVTFVE